MTKKNLILPACAFFLILIFILSSIRSCNSFKGEKILKTAIINPSQKENISSIEIAKNSSGLKLINRQGTWAGTGLVDFQENNLFFPVEQDQVLKFIDKLGQIINYSSIEGNNFDFKEYDLTDEKSILLNIYDNQGKETCLQIGKTDFSGKNRFVLINGQNKIYKMEWNLDSFLHQEARFWFDPYILPRNTEFSFDLENISKIVLISHENSFNLKSKNFNKLIELRHGSLHSGDYTKLQKVNSISMILQDKTAVSLDFYSTQQDDFVIFYNLNQNWNYSTFISSWTYSKILELFQ